MGADAIALPMLRDLISHFRDAVKICGVFTPPDKRSGRGMKLHSGEVKKWALEHNIDVFQPRKIAPENLDWLRRSGCDLILVMAYGKILKRELLDIPALGTLNLHASLLPEYRGASPIEAAIDSGVETTGVTLMRIIPEIDAGPVFGTETVAISQTDTAPAVRESIAAASVLLMRRCLPDILARQADFKPQDDGLATYTRQLIKEDSTLDFSVPARDLSNRIRALQPWPGSSFKFNGVRIKIGKAQYLERAAKGSPGEVIGDSEGALALTTGKGILLLLELQRPGGRMLDAPEFLRGFPIPQESVLKGGPMRQLSAPHPFKS